NRRFMTVGPLMAATGLSLLSLVTVHSPYLAVIGPLVVIAIGMGMTFVPLTLTVMSRVQPHEAGLASALLNTSQQIGGSLGLAVLVTVATSVTRAHQVVGLDGAAALAASRQAITTGYQSAFHIASGVAFFGFLLAATVVRGAKPLQVTAPEPEQSPEAEPAIA
ncbi:MAG TPA: MFS transporter, partial [Acidimicrobiales bacterium]|nr:MFS transporter [Acidimicrobiales bacterium]